MTIIKQSAHKSFFMLTPIVRDNLLECKLTAAEWRIWCYLVSLDPFGDSGAKFSPAELMLKCGIKKTAYFKAKAKFQQLGLFDFQDGVTKVVNLQGHSAKTDYSQQEKLIESANAESQSANAESQSANAESQSANAESQEPEPLPDKGSGSLQTLQTFQTPQTGGEEEKVFSRFGEETAKENKFTNLKDELLNLNQEKLSDNNSGEDQFSAQPATNRLKSNPQVKEEADQKINEELEEQLRSLEIPLDQVVRKCIEKHHISQVQKAIAHIENTWEDIRNPRSVFLYQVPKQTVEKPLKNPLTPEFLDWYSGAISQGLVLDRPAKTLPLNHFREPLVILPDGRQMDWQRVRDGDVQPLLSPSESGEFWAGIRAQLLKCTQKD
jgi:hypothetical protein